MATVSHTIYSHYDPKDRKRLERETGQLEDEIEAAESWVTQPPKYRKQGPAPRFVAATSIYDTWDVVHASSSRQKLNQTDERAGIGSETVNWYRSLRGSFSIGPSSAPPAAAPETTTSSVSEGTRISVKRDKNNWFIMKATQSEPSSSRTTPAPTLADILARDPPPKPNERKYTPPVWLEIGPGNKGFAMLQKSGWSEGEALGPDVLRWKRKTDEMNGDLFRDERSGANVRVWGKGMGMGNGKWPPLDVNQVRPKEVIDLTSSDSGSDGEHEVDADDPEKPAKIVKSEFVEREFHGPLGIGLKAKTFGPYKESKKRVTHSAAALAAHIRGAEELRKQKNAMGRGRKGFERQYKRAAMKREMMLAYMNS
ncbi:hypothetical protein F5887DRAFT_1059695 [Amanita rubescens]|nr:hypothetical protein F5887DRAFT_1059695 [Amanita rubescens]